MKVLGESESGCLKKREGSHVCTTKKEMFILSRALSLQLVRIKDKLNQVELKVAN